MSTAIKNHANFKQYPALSQQCSTIILDILHLSKVKAYIKNLNELTLAYDKCNMIEAVSAGLLLPDQIIGKKDSDLIWKISADALIENDLHVIKSQQPFFLEEKVFINGEWVEYYTKKYPKSSQMIINGLSGFTTEKPRNQKEYTFFNNIINFIDCVYFGVLTEDDLQIIHAKIYSIPQKVLIDKLCISQPAISKKTKQILSKLGLDAERDLFDLFCNK